VGIDYFFYYYAPACERWILADNSQIPFRVIAEGTKDDFINIKDEKTYSMIRQMAINHHNYAEESGDILSL
jgi:threonine dehydratase